MEKKLKPKFDFEKSGIEINPEEIRKEAKRLLESFASKPHGKILSLLLEQIEVVNFRELANITDEKEKLGQKHYLICVNEQIMKIAHQNNWKLCKSNGLAYLYNSEYWDPLEDEVLEAFLGSAAEKMGVYKFDAKLYSFRERLLKQFYAVAYLPQPNHSNNEVTINLKNGTYVIGFDKRYLKPPDPNDFLCYQLPFDYDPNAKAPLFENYLEMVQPDKARQDILAEYLGYLFIKPHVLKLEKALLLFGTGANGKSVFFEVVYSLLGGDKNVTNFSLQELTNESGNYRAALVGKILNYASEINAKLNSNTFKQLVSGEPVSARRLYEQPITISNYAKFIFNCNELPKEVEQSHAYFRRFLIVPFDVTIPDDKQDKELSKKIIEQELAGVFNWILKGLDRLLINKKFTYSKVVDEHLELYKKMSDSVQMFLEEEGYQKSTEYFIPTKTIYQGYRLYCQEGGYVAVSRKNLCERLRRLEYIITKKSDGLVVYMQK
ncbi:DNA primase family protein [Ferruginibacter albus]|uniref:DNA primase family protein n=1 Tax=Ferruginibacter albus TaxID=2875540 RepID=UPI001CC40BD6|nr:phage/plasmid primase, P4 family [Ferruginibacter albus]UAY51288.1 DUF5906 domain-containing protein [Ferruginibacter albus]